MTEDAGYGSRLRLRMSLMVVCGIDPGGRETGIIWRRGNELVEWSCYDRHRGESDVDYVAALPWGDGPASGLVAVEGVVAPNGHMGQINVGGLLGTAVMLGAVLAYCTASAVPCVVVPPAGHGSGPGSAYPEALRAKPGGADHDLMRHCRSAWDISYAGEHSWQLDERLRETHQ